MCGSLQLSCVIIDKLLGLSEPCLPNGSKESPELLSVDGKAHRAGYLGSTGLLA